MSCGSSGKNWALVFSNEAAIARPGAEWIIGTLQLLNANSTVALDYRRRLNQWRVTLPSSCLMSK